MREGQRFMDVKSRKSLIQSFRPLKKYLGAHRRMFSVGLSFAFLTTAIGITIPLILKLAVDSIEKKAGAYVLLGIVGLLVGVTLVEGVFRFLMRRILIGISRKIEFSLRADLFEHLETLPLSFYQSWRIGDLMSRASNDLNEVRMLMGPAIMYSFQTVVTVVFSLPVMAYINTRLMVLALLPMALVSLSYRKIGRVIHDRSMAVQRRLSDITAKAQENVAGIRVVKSFTREESEIEQFDELNQDYLRLNMRLVKVSGLLFPFMSFLGGVTSLSILGYGGVLVTRGAITLGDFTAFFSYMSMLYWPMIAVGFVLNIIERGRASLGRIMEIFETQSEIRDTEPPASTAVVSGKARGRISFRNLGFRYPGSGRPVLRDLRLEVSEGETVAVIGPVGCGKSTLLSLIPRLYNPPAGSLFIDGRDVLDWPLKELRRSVGIVPQETFLFSESIRENILYGLSSQVEENEILKVVRTAGLYGDLKQFPDELDTLLGERGINLSGGQKQRTTLSRALMIDPPILLLDDSFSSVDVHTEEEILRALREFMKNRTTIIVSHRISTIKFADRIVVLEKGRITQQGTHRELIKEPGYYWSMYEKQLLEEKIERIG